MSMLESLTQDQHERLYLAALLGASEVAATMERIGIGDAEECLTAAPVLRKVLLRSGGEGVEHALLTRLMPDVVYQSFSFEPDHGPGACLGCGVTSGVALRERAEVHESAGEAGMEEEMEAGCVREIRRCAACGRTLELVRGIDMRSWR